MKKKWTILEAIISLFFFLMLVVAFLGVVTRYVFNRPVLFNEELARTLMVYIVLLGAIINTRDKEQLKVTFLTQFLSSKVNKKLNLVLNIIIVLAMIALVYYGVLLAIISGAQYTTALKIPFPIIYSTIPFMSMIILLYHLRDIISSLKERAASQRREKIRNRSI